MTFKLQITDTITSPFGIDFVNPIVLVGISVRQVDSANYTVGFSYTYFKDEAAFENKSQDLSPLLPSEVPLNYSKAYTQIDWDLLDKGTGAFVELLDAAVTDLEGTFAAVAVDQE